MERAYNSDRAETKKKSPFVIALYIHAFVMVILSLYVFRPKKPAIQVISLNAFNVQPKDTSTDDEKGILAALQVAKQMGEVKLAIDRGIYIIGDTAYLLDIRYYRKYKLHKTDSFLVPFFK